MTLVSCSDLKAPDAAGTWMASWDWNGGKDADSGRERWTEPAMRSGRAGIRRRLRAILPAFIELDGAIECSSDPLQSIGQLLGGAKRPRSVSGSVTLKLTPACAERIRNEGPGFRGHDAGETTAVGMSRSRFGNWQLIGAAELPRRLSRCSGDDIPRMPSPLFESGTLPMPSSLRGYAYCGYRDDGRAVLVLMPDREQAIYREWS